MTDPAAPPPPGTDTPVPADAAARAAAAGRARQVSAASAPGRDRLVPATALESRAAERARLRRERLSMPGMVGAGSVVHGSVVSGAFVPGAAPPVPNPAAGMAGGARVMPPGLVPAVADSMPPRLVPQQWGPQPGPYGMVYGGAPYGTPPTGPQQGTFAVATAAHAGQQGQPGPYGAAPYPTGPSSPGPYGAGPYPPAPVFIVPPRIRWTTPQRRAAILGSWAGQTVMALATHFLTAFVLIVGFAFLLHISGEPVDEFDADSWTAIVSRWSMPDRVWATALIGLLLGGVGLALGWLLSALWARSAGLAKPHRSAWLAWLCTTAATGFVGIMLWPLVLFGGMISVIASSSSSLTIGSMWSMLFWAMALAVVLTGLVGLLFGWLFLSTARPRVDLVGLMAEEEARQRAADEAELTAVRLRGEPA
ncbi:hypothetical protein [Agrococcus sediminis]|uniref:hypothetical protein n=1 Tax=Agrococcus sediminis TaxID=2599924 RepID=UPI00342FA5C2